MIPPSAAVSGLVLAGGAARRMGGVQKGLQLLHGRPLMAWVIERLLPQVQEILISANDQTAAYERYGYPVLPDAIRESDGSRAGPLAGLDAGLRACSHPLLATVPCDAPLLPVDLVERLRHGLTGAHADVAVASVGGRPQPVFVLVRREVLAQLSAYLQQARRRADGWYCDLNWVAVPFENERAFANVNTLDELRGMESGGAQS